MKVRVTIRAIHDADLVNVLRRLGLYEDVVEGRRRCFACGREVRLDNVGGLFKGMDGEVKFVCGDVKCLMMAVEETSKRRDVAARERG